MFGSIGFTELILILVIVLIIFGAGKLPQLGEGVGKAIKGFKKSVQEAEPMEPEPQAQAPTQAIANEPGGTAQMPPQSQPVGSSTPAQQTETPPQAPQAEAVSPTKA